LNKDEYFREFYGPWAWFKLLDQSKISKIKKSDAYLVSFVLADLQAGQSSTSPLRTLSEQEITYQIKPESVDNLLQNNLLGSFRCPKRI